MNNNILQTHFASFRKHIIGNDLVYKTPYGNQRLIYADWIASGRLYAPIEKIFTDEVAPYVANTHTETSETGRIMTHAYHHAHTLIKQHCHADEKDVILTHGFGMTGVINKFQRILGLKNNTKQALIEEERPVVFITHMEHHSNQTSWYETIADVVVVPPDDNLFVKPENLEIELAKYKNRKYKYGSFTACSNVTGIRTPYHQLAKIMHQHGGWCFVDFAASAPYDEIDMHPDDKEERLDAVLFSPHKFLGGPGSSGVLIFTSDLYNLSAPDQPGGGTVEWTNPWGEYKYIDDIETREDGGTPGFLQAMRTAMSIELKNKLDPKKMMARENELVAKSFQLFSKIPSLHILADNESHRLGAISFYIDDLHYNLVVKLLSDRFGIQVRGGCACAGTYGHFLLHVDHSYSNLITNKINEGDLSLKPGWIRLSLHPTLADDEVEFIADALHQIVKHQHEWGKDYHYNSRTNEYVHHSGNGTCVSFQDWFSL